MATSRNNQIDLVAALAKEILANPVATDDRKEWAADKLTHIARTRAVQRRDVRVKRLQAKLDAALKRIAELEAHAAPKIPNSLRDIIGMV